MIFNEQNSNPDTNGHKTAIAEEFSRLRFWVLLSASLLFLFVSIVWEAHEIQFTHGTGAEFQAANQRALIIFTPKPYIELFRELGFGCLIALVLIVFVERSSREEQAHSVEKQRAAISENVFKGVFSLHTPASIIESVSNQIFKAKVIREHHKNDYHFTEIANAGSQRFLQVNVTADYLLRNIADEEIRVPIRLGFPVPPVATFLDRVKVQKISIDGRELTAEEIQEGDQSAEDPPNRIRYAWYRQVPRGGSIHVIANYTLIKERSDNEVWQTLYPGLGMELTANINVQGLEFGVHPLHEREVTKLSGVGNTGTHRWALNEAVLPHQGMILWWRPQNYADEPPQPGKILRSNDSG
ncbi:MAG: hypothetical protein ACU843_00985 [Gammaproteobacteria bacterium]